jgi:hypothetical protein
MRRKVSPVGYRATLRIGGVSLTSFSLIPAHIDAHARGFISGKIVTPTRGRPAPQDEVLDHRGLALAPRFDFFADPALHVRPARRFVFLRDRSGLGSLSCRAGLHGPPVPYLPRPPLSWVDTAINKNQGPIRESTPWTRRESDEPKIKRGRPGTPFTVSGASHDSWGSRSRAKPRPGSIRAGADPGHEADDGRFTGKSTGRAPVVLGGAPRAGPVRHRGRTVWRLPGSGGRAQETNRDPARHGLLAQAHGRRASRGAFERQPADP